MSFTLGPTDIEQSRIFRTTHHHEHHLGPFFEEHSTFKSQKNDGHVSAVHLFTEAALNCRVGMLKDKTVSPKIIINKKGKLILGGAEVDIHL